MALPLNEVESDQLMRMNSPTGELITALLGVI